MRREIKVRLRRFWPPRFRTVTVRSLTLRRFIELSETAISGILPSILQEKGERTAATVLHAFADHPEVLCALADIVCPDEPPGFYAAFRTPKNNGLLWDAALGTNDWATIGSVVDLSRKVEPSMSLEGSVVFLCSEFPGMSPASVYDSWVDDVIRMSRGVAAIKERRSAGADNPEGIDTAQTIGRIPGATVVH